MKEESVEVQAVRACLAKVVQTREALDSVVSQKDTAARELNELMGERTAVQDRLTAREREIALTGGELPDDPFPEDAEIARLNRHVRIRQERVRGWESKVRESQGELETRVQELEESWGAVGTATSERLIERFREAALALRDAQVEYIAVKHHFYRGWSSAAWKFINAKLSIADPKEYQLLLDPMQVQVPERWPAGAQMLQKDMDDLRAQIDAVKLGQTGAPVTAGASEPETPEDDD